MHKICSRTVSLQMVSKWGLYPWDTKLGGDWAYLEITKEDQTTLKLLEHKAKLCQFSPIIITVACTGTLTARHTQYYGKSILVAEEILAESFRLMKETPVEK